MVSVGQKFESNVAVWFWLESSPKFAIRYQSGLKSFEGLTGLEDALSKCLSHMSIGLSSFPPKPLHRSP